MFEIVGASHIGKIRTINQDYFKICHDTNCAILADGVGGAPHGEVASKVAVEAVYDYLGKKKKQFSPQILLKGAVEYANQLLLSETVKNSSYVGMATTLEVIYCEDNRIYVAHIGDSSTCLLNNSNIWQITIDHNIATYQQRGLLTVEVQSKPSALVRVLGREGSTCDIYSKGLSPGEFYLLASDGLHKHIDKEDIVSYLNKNRDNINLVVKDLIQHANDNGGSDNITAIIVRITGDSLHTNKQKYLIRNGYLQISGPFSLDVIKSMTTEHDTEFSTGGNNWRPLTSLE